MELTVKSFDELTTTELYEILKARSEIFVVEQNIIYQDMDDIDYNSLHIFYHSGNKVMAYLRAFYKTEDKTVVKLGRVLTIEHGKGLGGKLLKESIGIVKEKMKPDKIYVEAQSHAIGYYERAGFVVCSEEFLEEGILHVQMELEL